MGFGDLGRKLVKIGSDTKNGVVKMSDSASINSKINAEKRSLERLFMTIGEAVYKADPDHPAVGLEDEYHAVKVAYANIEDLQHNLNKVRGAVYCPVCGRLAEDGDVFCPKCGTKLPEAEDSTGKKLSQDFREAGQETAKIAADVAGKTGEFLGSAAAATKNLFSSLTAKKSAEDAAEASDDFFEADEPAEAATATGAAAGAAGTEAEGKTSAAEGKAAAEAASATAAAGDSACAADESTDTASADAGKSPVSAAGHMGRKSWNRHRDQREERRRTGRPNVQRRRSPRGSNSGLRRKH